MSLNKIQTQHVSVILFSLQTRCHFLHCELVLWLEKKLPTKFNSFHLKIVHTTSCYELLTMFSDHQTSMKTEV